VGYPHDFRQLQQEPDSFAVSLPLGSHFNYNREQGSLNMKEDRLTDTASSFWRTAYISAQLEHNPDKVAARIAEALDAINLRLNGSTEIGQAEHDAIEAARHGLESLRAQRVSMVGETLGL